LYSTTSFKRVSIWMQLFRGWHLIGVVNAMNLLEGSQFISLQQGLP
jgi:hypothetical protein